MMKRIFIVLVSALTLSTVLWGCNKKDQPTPNTDPAAATNAQAPAADAQAPAAPAAGMDENGAPLPPPTTDGAPVPPAPAADNVPSDIPAEANEAFNNIYDVLSGLGDIAKKENCAVILAELKNFNNADTKAKLEKGKKFQEFGPAITEAIYKQNRPKIMVSMKSFQGFEKCASSPENESIKAEIMSIMSVIAPEGSAIPTNSRPAVAGGAAAPGISPEAAAAAKAAVDAASKDAASAKAAVNDIINQAAKDSEAVKAAANKAIDNAVKDSAEAKAAAADIIDAAAKDPEAAKAAAAKAIAAAAKDPDAAKAAIDAAAKDPAAAKAAAEAMLKAAGNNN